MGLEDDGIKRDETVTQAVFDPITGMNITGAYVSDSKKELNDELDKIFAEAKARKMAGEEPNKIFAELTEQIRFVIEKFYRSLKLPPDDGVVAGNLSKLAQFLDVQP